MKPWKDVNRYGSVGLELLASIAIGFFVGRFLDNHFHTRAFIWIFTILGTYAGFRALFTAGKAMQRQIEKEDRENPHQFRDPEDEDWDD